MNQNKNKINMIKNCLFAKNFISLLQKKQKFINVNLSILSTISAASNGSQGATIEMKEALTNVFEATIDSSIHEDGIYDFDLACIAIKQDEKQLSLFN